jgi:hypothetical protein
MKHALKTRGDETVEATRVIRLTEETSELREQSGGLSQARSHVDGTQAIEGGIEPSLGGIEPSGEAQRPFGGLKSRHIGARSHLGAHLAIIETGSRTQ